MKNSLIVLIVVLFFSCNSKENQSNDLQNFFTDLKGDEYWGIYSAYHNFKFNGNYVKFYNNGTYKNYKWDKYGRKFEADTIEIKKWSVTKDSILSYNFRFRYKIVLINEGAILISSGGKETTFMFIKESEKHRRKLDWHLHTDSLKLNNPTLRKVCNFEQQ
ncbi:hypothetical protein P3875_01670 [Myroides sp. JBRI-B21084]|uniref:hypothetical protein n=1 Tax=Myroides sp. JBRI-B21084 TaxID=3119977 RepID=UPI0026E2553C|nr:hypothetical protein [Paenimyroides cloacae]WKW46809.1 hypothetical protein P3875_01670 [Paenimyroides cloacae]